jgi:hypothetical protein
METPQPDLIHATGCKHPSLRYSCVVEAVTVHIILRLRDDDKSANDSDICLPTVRKEGMFVLFW